MYIVAAYSIYHVNICLRYVSTVATGAWYARQYELAIFATAISSLLGWPFAALLGYFEYSIISRIFYPEAHIVNLWGGNLFLSSSFT